MKTAIKVLEKKGIILAILAISLSTPAMAFEFGNFMNGLSKDISNDGHVSFIIISSILGFGLIMFLLNKFLAKHSKNEGSPPRNHRQNSPRHHHHHRVIKKSA